MASTTTTEPLAPLETVVETGGGGSGGPCLSPLSGMSPIPVGLIAVMLALHLRRRKVPVEVVSDAG